MTRIIDFELFQAITFTLASSLFLYMTLAFIGWIIENMKARRRPGRR